MGYDWGAACIKPFLSSEGGVLNETFENYLGEPSKKKTTKFWTLSKHGEGGQRRSQTFYRKKVWTQKV